MSEYAELENAINNAWEQREQLSGQMKVISQNTVSEVLDLLAVISVFVAAVRRVASPAGAAVRR